MRVLVSGATGLVGRYLVASLQAAGHVVTAAGRQPPPAGLFAAPSLPLPHLPTLNLSAPVGFVPLALDPHRDQRPAFAGIDAFVHAAFDHVAGRYRGGEGDDPQRFLRLNRDGTIRLFAEAKAAGLQRAVFLSSRAVYDGLTPAATPLDEDRACRPTSLYGQMKLACEDALAGLNDSGFTTASLRPTGVYGDLRPNKWDALFQDYRAGRPIPARAGTEVHGRDVGAALLLLLAADPQEIGGKSFNLSDLTLDTRTILAGLEDQLHPLPASAATDGLAVMPTQRMRALGWQPGGWPLFHATMRLLAKQPGTPLSESG